MNTYFKIQRKRLLNFSLFLISGVLAVGIPALAFQIPEKNDTKEQIVNNFVKEELLTIGENTLISNSSPISPESKANKTIQVVITAYSSTVEETDSTPFITASNTTTRDGVIANNLLPFGTKVRIPEVYGDKIFVVEDRMNARKSGYQFDVWLPSHVEAEQFGVKRTYIEILEG
jgi:3D (Asp-Asp-Asp) domain-containing protein